MLSFAYGVFLTIVVMRWCFSISNKGTTYGECPYCNKMATIHYETMYECSECRERHTDDEIKEKALYNEWEEDQEQEREFQRLHKDQRKQEYKEKIRDLNKEYDDIRQ
jgi:hypothetical protein